MIQLWKGFAQAALLHSDLIRHKNGELGWVKETSINKIIKEKLINLKIKKITKPIRIPSGFIIIQVKDKREIDLDVNIDNEIKLIIQKKTNEQLNQLSKIYFNKIKKNIEINDYKLILFIGANSVFWNFSKRSNKILKNL